MEFDASPNVNMDAFAISTAAVTLTFDLQILIRRSSVGSGVYSLSA